MKKIFRTQTGRFLAGLIALALVAAVLAGVRQLPFLQADITRQQVMSMSEEAIEIARSIDKDVTIAYLATDTGMDVWADGLARKYPEQNSRITYRVVDPSSAEAADLAGVAGMTLTENSMVVTCEDRSLVIESGDMYKVTYDETYYYYYGEMVPTSQQFVADSQIANALLYVTRDDLPVVYTLSGHGETAVSGTLLSTIQQNNIRLADLQLEGAVPEDAAAVLVYAPTSDLTAGEADALISYLNDGGQMILLTDYSLRGFANLNRVTAAYGMEPVEGLVLETDTAYCYAADYPYYVMPDVGEHEITALIADTGMKPVMSYAGAIARNAEERDGLTVTALATTSETSYIKAAELVATLEQEEGDTSGPFALAMIAEENGARLVWFASAAFASDMDIQLSSSMNSYILLSTIGSMATLESRTAIESAELMMDSLALPAGSKIIVYAAVFVPALAMMIVGLIRRKGKKAQ